MGVVPDRGGVMVYSPHPVETERDRTPDLAALEEKVGELERLADTLSGAPEGELAAVLEEAVRLLGEVNDRLEAGIRDAEEGAREVGSLLEGLDFGPFDEALESLERQERADEPDGA